MADNKDKAKPSPKKPVPGNVFDVRRPGKAPAPPTSRPVILGHKPEAEAAQAAVSGIGETNPMLNRRKIQIIPSEDAQEIKVAKPAKDESAPADEPQVTDADGTPVPEEDQDALAAAALDAVAGPPDLPKVEPEEEAPQPLADKPQDTGEEKPSQDKEARPMVFSKPKLIIQPLTETAKPAAAEPKEESKADAGSTEESQPEAQETPAPDASDPKPEPTPEQSAPAAEEPSEAPAKEETSFTAPAAEESASALTDEQKPAEDGPQEEAQEGQKEEQKPEPHIEPLFDEHGPLVVSRNHGTHGHGAQAFLLILLILILAAAALDILLDLNVLNFPNIPHTDFL